jgi:hypothetical protein
MGLPLTDCRSGGSAMDRRIFSRSLRLIATLVGLCFALSSLLCAQGPIPDAPGSTDASAAPLTFVTPATSAREHKFWDRENKILLSTSFALNGADFVVTRSNLQSGGQELNPVVRVFGRSTAGLIANFTGESAGSLALSYFFHRTGHHRMERAVSCVNIGGSATAVAFGLMHR